jgi:hypothetical protein
MPTACDILMNSLRSARGCQYPILFSLCLRGGEKDREEAQEDVIGRRVPPRRGFGWVLGEDVRFVHLLMNCVPSLKNSLGTSASSCSVSDMMDGMGSLRSCV